MPCLCSRPTGFPLGRFRTGGVVVHALNFLSLGMKTPTIGYTWVSKDYRFDVITASEINVDSILIYGSNDAEIWRQITGIKARNELSGSEYQIWYYR